MQERWGEEKKPIIPSVGWAWTGGGRTHGSARCAHSSPTDTHRKKKKKKKALDLSWTLVSAWLPPAPDQQKKTTPCAIHAGWRNGVGLLRCLSLEMTRSFSNGAPPVFSPLTGYPTSANLTLWGLVIRPPLLLLSLLLLHNEATPFFLPQCVSSVILSRRRAIVDA